MRKNNQKAMTFCGRLREIRETRGLSLSEAAKLSGISKATISKMESGRQPNPTLRTMLLGSRLYGFSLEDWADLQLLDDGALSTTSIQLLEEVLSSYELDMQLRGAICGAGLRATLAKVQEFVVERSKALANPLTPSAAEKLSLESAIQWLEQLAEGENPSVKNHVRKLLERLEHKTAKEKLYVD